jgi:DNA-binding transcriptional LysR family regulator
MIDIGMNNIRNVDLNLLVVFDALFDERSVTRAAERLAVTQPTVSGLLRRLRRTFSDQLFLRTSHGILPTPRAEALAGAVKKLLADAQSLVSAVTFDPATAETTIKICGSDYLQYAVISPLVSAIRHVAPKIRVIVAPRPDAHALADVFARGEMDLSISAREVVLPDLTSRLLYRDRYICVARKNHPLKARRISVKQLCAFDHLLVDPTGTSFSGVVDAILSKSGHRRRVATTVPTFHLLFDILETDDFIAFVPEGFLRTRSSILRVFETNLALPAIEVLASWHPRLNRDAQHKWLRELLVKIVKSQTYQR